MIRINSKTTILDISVKTVVSIKTDKNLRIQSIEANTKTKQKSNNERKH